MQTDRITRVLLVAILLCLVVLIVQSFSPEPTAPAPAVTRADASQPDDDGEVTYQDRRGRVVKHSDLIVLIQTVGNEALPMDMRIWALFQLEGIENEQASETLIAALDHEDLVFSTAALQALAGNHDPRVRAAAMAGLEHEDEDVRVISQYVLDSLADGPAEGP